MSSLKSYNPCKVSIVNKTEINLNYIWKISNIMNRPHKIGDRIESESFSSGLDYGDEWCLLCYPHGITDEDGDRVGIYIQLKSSKKPVINAKFEVAVVDHCDEEYEERTIKCISKVNQFTEGDDRGFSSFINREELLDLLILSEGHLIISCNLTIVEEHHVRIEPKPQASVSLANQLGIFFENQKFGDVTFNIGGKRLHAHKSVLMARSPVFSDMFQRKEVPHPHEPRELPLCGVQFEAFKELLYFIYTDRSPNLNDLLPRLLLLSNHYQVQGLKNLCEKSLLESLDIEKAAQYLCIADQARSQELKTRIINYIKANLHEVLETKGFRIMKQKYPDMLVELLRASSQ